MDSYTFLPGAVAELASASSHFFSPSLVGSGGRVFSLDNVEYLAITTEPTVEIPYFSNPYEGPATHIAVSCGTVTDSQLRKTADQFLHDDDVFSEGFLQKIIVSGNVSDSLESSDNGSLVSNIVYPCNQGSCGCSSPQLTLSLPYGPLYAVANGTTLKLSKVSRLYEDPYQTFVNGIYELNGEYRTLDYVEPHWGYPKIPVPSRLYSLGDHRPLAGQRVGVKDIFDVKGVLTTLGSRAYSAVNGPANVTAPSIQRIIDLGAVFVGKQKTAQFASAQPCWEWFDLYCPRNPRGDGLLSCSASSTGAGCSIAAYDWLDFAIGSDTGQSVRQPAAFSGTYGIRPSQGLMSLDHVMPIGYAVDTAGVFSRDPEAWAKFAKFWYAESLFQNTSMTGLPPLVVPDDRTYAKRILYSINVLPLRNPAAETVLQNFLAQVTDALGISVEQFNMTQTIEATTGRSFPSIVDDLNVLFTEDQRRDVALPLLKHYEPHFPAFEQPFVDLFWNITLRPEEHAQIIERRKEEASLWESQVLAQTNESCSESLIIYDIGTGGRPSFRMSYLNEDDGASFANDPNGYSAMSVVASYFGSVDITVPIGQVTYFSNITREENYMPVTVSMMARRGCDFVLLNMISELKQKGVLQTVLTGRQAFQ